MKRKEPVSAWQHPYYTTLVWTSFRGCSSASGGFRPADLLATQIAPTVALSCRAAMAFTSEQNTSRYLLVHRIY